MGAVGEEGEGGAHAEPAECTNELADFEVRHEKAPLAEEEGPVADVAVDQGKGLGASVFHVSPDVEEVFEKPEGGEDEAVGLSVEIEIQTTEQRDEEFAEGAAEEHESVAAPREEKMAGFVDHEVDEIGKEKTGGVAEGVEEEERIDEEPGDSGIAGDGIPGLGFRKIERHGNRVTME